MSRRQNKAFLRAMMKLKERLQIIIDHNVSQKLDPIEGDITLMEELSAFFDKSSLDWFQEKEGSSDDSVQQALFSDKKTDK